MLNMIKQKRVYIIAAIISMALSVTVLFYMSSRSATMPSLKMSDDFSTYEDLVDHSPIVVMATVTSGNKEFDYAEMTFAITEVEIIDHVRGDESAKTLQILQTRSEEDPYLKKGTQVLLFLSEYNGPIAQNVYVINGLYNGQYVIDDGTLCTAKTANAKTTPLANTDLESVILDVKNTEYKAATQEAPSIAEIEQANELEKELESQAISNKNKTSD